MLGQSQRNITKKENECSSITRDVPPQEDIIDPLKKSKPCA
jgi:hypothetical protein